MSEPIDQEKQITDNLVQLRAKTEGEPIASFLDMRLLELSPGYAKVAMKLTPDYQNFNGLIFGGIKLIPVLPLSSTSTSSPVLRWVTS